MQPCAIVILPYFLHSNKRISTEKMPAEKTWRCRKISRKNPLMLPGSFAETAGFSETVLMRGFTERDVG